MLANTGDRLILSLLTMILVINISFSLEACRCDSAFINEFTFTNNKLSTQHYAVQKGGSAALWTTITPMTFTLQPGRSKTIVAFTSIPCNAPIGLHKLDVIALSEESSLKQSIEFNVGTCHDFDLTVNEGFSVCVDDDSSIPFTLTNTGLYPESVVLTSNHNLSLSNVTIGVNESVVINALVKADFIGEFEVNFQAVSDYKTINKTFTFDSAACSYFDVDFNIKVVELCEDEQAQLSIRITNEGKVNHFHFLTESDFITLPDEAVLYPNQVYQLPLVISSSCSPGIESAVITVYAEGSERVAIPLTVDFKSCYQPIVMASSSSRTACGCDQTSYDFVLYNPGSKTVQYALSSSLGSVYYNNKQVDSITMLPRSEALIKVVHQLPCDSLGDYNYSLTAASVSVCSKLSSDNVNVKVKSWNDCQSVQLSGLTDYRITDESVVIPFIIKNIGDVATGYSIQVSGSAMPYLMGLSDSHVNLNPGQDAAVELTMSAINETDAFLTVQALSDDNLAGDSLTFYFHTGLISYKGLYYLTIPASIIVISSMLLYRKKRILTKK